jgi:hypothetical protein
MVNTAHADEDHVICGVVSLDIQCKVIMLDQNNVVLVPKNGVTKWLTCE